MAVRRARPASGAALARQPRGVDGRPRRRRGRERQRRDPGRSVLRDRRLAFSPGGLRASGSPRRPPPRSRGDAQGSRRGIGRRTGIAQPARGERTARSRRRADAPACHRTCRRARARRCRKEAAAAVVRGAHPPPHLLPQGRRPAAGRDRARRDRDPPAGRRTPGTPAAGRDRGAGGRPAEARAVRSTSCAKRVRCSPPA